MHTRRVQGLILSHLALLTGCDGPMPPEPTVIAPPMEVPTASSDPVTAATTPPTEPRATPEPTTPPSTVATNDPPPPAPSVTPGGAGDVGAPCNDRTDCRAGLYCRLGFTGAEFIRPGACSKDRPIYKGRPLMVAGARHEAPLGRDAGWLDGSIAVSTDPQLARELRSAALEEHASVAAFGRTLCALAALGGPPHLLRGTQEAIGDEIRHTQICLRWAEAFDGEALAPGALPAATAPFADDLARELLVDVIRGGCIGETLAAAELLEEAGRHRGSFATDLEAMAEDETRHAALAFATARWLVATHPELEATLRAELERFRTEARPEHQRLVGPLLTQLT